MDVKVARLAQTFGAGIPLTDNRTPMQFARAAIEGKDIVLHTEGKSISNFVYLVDAITGILTILEKGKAGQAYNVCNDKETRSVREIAELVKDKVSGGKIEVKVEKKENMGYAPDVAMYIDSGKLRSLGWKAGVGMAEAYRRLIEYLRQN
jgi:UDP-glucuronate decarboxylase